MTKLIQDGRKPAKLHQEILPSAHKTEHSRNDTDHRVPLGKKPGKLHTLIPPVPDKEKKIKKTPLKDKR